MGAVLVVGKLAGRTSDPTDRSGPVTASRNPDMTSVWFRAFDAVLNAVVMELQRTPGAKVKITVEAEAEAGFDEADIGVVRDNARRLKFRPDSTGFE